MHTHHRAHANRRQVLVRGATLLATAALVSPRITHAQTWPAKPIRILVPYAAGTPPDISARLVAGHLTPALGQSVYVENKPGAIGMVATKELLQLPADGYTLLYLVIPLVTAQALLPAQSVDLQKELAPISQVDSIASVLVVTNDLPVSSARELIALMKAKPNGLNFGSGGNGTPAHLAGELFMKEYKATATHVPYARFAQVVPDLISGRLQFMFLTSTVAVPLVKSGKIKAIGVAGAKRLAALPDLPTLGEQGLGNFDTSNWSGIAARAGTPADIITRLNRELAAVLAKPDVIQQMEKQGMTPAPSSPEQFGQLLASEAKRWAAVIRDAGITTQ